MQTPRMFVNIPRGARSERLLLAGELGCSLLSTGLLAWGDLILTLGHHLIKGSIWRVFVQYGVMFLSWRHVLAMAYSIANRFSRANAVEHADLVRASCKDFESKTTRSGLQEPTYEIPLE